MAVYLPLHPGPALTACGVLLAVSAAVPVLALRYFHKGSIVEQLRAAE